MKRVCLVQIVTTGYETDHEDWQKIGCEIVAKDDWRDVSDDDYNDLVDHLRTLNTTSYGDTRRKTFVLIEQVEKSEPATLTIESVLTQAREAAKQRRLLAKKLKERQAAQKAKYEASILERKRKKLEKLKKELGE